MPLHAARPFDRVVCSPCIRTTQTASYIGASLGIPISFAPGLAACAMAVEYIGIHNFEPREGEAEVGPLEAVATPADAPSPLLARAQQPPPRFRSARAAAPLCAPGSRFEGESDDRVFEPFLPCLERLAAAAAGGRLLVVGHREGIRDLCDYAGQPHGRTEYCCVTRLLFDGRRAQDARRAPGDGAWTLLGAPTTEALVDG